MILWSNNFQTTLALPLAIGATSMTLAAGTGANLPNPTGGDYFSITMTDAATETRDEVIYCYARTGDVLTNIIKAQEGTSDQAWIVGDIAGNLVTAGTLEDIQEFKPDTTGSISTTIAKVLRKRFYSDNFPTLQDAVNAAATESRILEIDPTVTYNYSSSLIIPADGIIIEGNNALYNYAGTSNALGFALIGGVRYPVNIIMRDLNITVNTGTSSSGMIIRASYSEFENIGISLKSAASSAKGFVLLGDGTNGTGPYYNDFKDCDVQSESLSTDHIGVLFTADSGAPTRGPNANTWIGGRIGQCATAFSIRGNGNSLLDTVVENATGLGTAYYFTSPSSNTCAQNRVVSKYIENASVAYKFDSGASGNTAIDGYATGIGTLVQDANSPTTNMVISTNTNLVLPTGIKFPTASSSDPNVLNYFKQGTWTPGVQGAASAGTYTITTTDAIYTRIGNLITISANMAISSTASGSGAAQFLNLPFPKLSGRYLSGSVRLTNVTLPSNVQGLSIAPYTSGQDNTFTIEGTRSATTPYIVQIGDLNSGAVVDVTFSYMV